MKFNPENILMTIEIDHIPVIVFGICINTMTIMCYVIIILIIDIIMFSK